VPAVAKVFLSAFFWLQLLVCAREVCSGVSRGGARDPKVQRYGSDHVCVSIAAVPIIKLFAWGERDSGGHVLRDTRPVWTSLPITH
jgi:hypothetical protein